MKTVRRRLPFAASSVLLVLTFALAQETPPAKTNPNLFSAFARRRGSIAVEQPQSATRPHWSSDFAFTPDTALSNATANYDPATNTMIVFGGNDWGMEETLTNAVLLNAPANGSGTWTTLISNGEPGSPSVRAGHTAVYDSANNRIIAFGGCTTLIAGVCGSLVNDVWVLSNANGQGGTPVWTQLSPSGSLPAARSNHTAVYDVADNRMIIFGGGDERQRFSDVWLLSNANGMGGTPAWTQLSPSGGAPAGVYYSSAIYDPTNHIMTVFGGYNLAQNAATNGVWTLSHANGLGGTSQWVNIVADGALGSPSKRVGHTAVYDVGNNRMIIFGGGPFSTSAGSTGFNDVWVLTNANGVGGTPAWAMLNTSGPKPGTRFDHTAVYDAVNNRMMVHGGDNADAAFYCVWVLSRANGL